MRIQFCRIKKISEIAKEQCGTKLAIEIKKNSNLTLKMFINFINSMYNSEHRLRKQFCRIKKISEITDEQCDTML